jgi:PPOX class probable F420-dependent enzyme
MAVLDLARPRHAQIDQRLRAEPIIWLSTVRPDGRPHLVPVWFWWDGATVLIFSKPDSQKVRNLRHNPQVVVALDTADEGEDVALFEGRAELLAEGVAQAILPAFAAKYAALFVRIGSTPERMAKEYSQAIRVTLTKLVMG